MDILTLKLMLQDLILAAQDDNLDYSDAYNAGYDCAISNIVVQIQMLEQGTLRISNELVLDDKELGIVA